MTGPRYAKRHYEDIARVLHHARAHEPKFGTGHFTAISQAIMDFAILFATDNPPTCNHCGQPRCEATEICSNTDGKLYEEHLFEGGFDRTKFLQACGVGES